MSDRPVRCATKQRNGHTRGHERTAGVGLTKHVVRILFLSAVGAVHPTYSYETWGAPVIDMCHHSGTYAGGRSHVRIEAHDELLRLLDAPKLVEDIRFAEPLPASGTVGPASSLVWTVDPARVSASAAVYRERLRRDAPAGVPVEPLAEEVSTSLSGIALWPRIVLDEDRSLVYNSRGEQGEAQQSHFPTFLPLLSERPPRVEPGGTVRASWEVDLRDGKVTTPLKYSLECELDPPDCARLAELMLSD